MDVTALLDGFRSDVGGCDIAAFADLSSQMILCVSSSTKHAQEDLDALTETAASVLGGAMLEGAAALLDGHQAQSIVSMTPLEARVYLRSEKSGNEVLICVCAADADIGKIATQGAKTLAEITASAS